MEGASRKEHLISPLGCRRTKWGLAADDVEPYPVTHGWLQDSSKSSADVGSSFPPAGCDGVHAPAPRFGDYVFGWRMSFVMVQSLNNARLGV